MPATLRRLLASDWTPVLLTWSCLLLLPFGRLVELPTLIMAIAGIVLLWRHGRQLAWAGGGRLFTVLFLCIWLPMLLSLPDAVNLTRSSGDVAAFIRLYFAGLFIVWTLSSPLRRERLLHLSAAVIAFWVIDAVVQAVRGVDLFGFHYPPGRLNALYGERHIDFGPALATLSPLLLEPVRRHGRTWLTTSVFMAVLATVFLAGSRGAWISFALVGTVLFILHAREFKLPLGKAAIAALLLVGVTLGALLVVKPDAYSRVAVTLKALKGDYQSLNEASSLRMVIWGTSLRMIAANPVNGVGISGYRHAYPDYAPPGDALVDPIQKTGPTYSHQILLDVAVGAGAVGLLGLVVFYVFLLRLPSRAPPTAVQAALPFLLAAWAWVFPLNAHPHFYSSQWSQLIWWLLALACAALAGRGEDKS